MKCKTREDYARKQRRQHESGRGRGWRTLNPPYPVQCRNIVNTLGRRNAELLRAAAEHPAPQEWDGEDWSEP